MAELSKRIEVVIPIDNGGSDEVAGRGADGLFEVVTPSTLEASRTWVEERGEWRSQRLTAPLIGRLEPVSSLAELAQAAGFETEGNR